MKRNPYNLSSFQNKLKKILFEFLTALTMMNALFWDVTSYSLEDVYFSTLSTMRWFETPVNFYSTKRSHNSRYSIYFNLKSILNLSVYMILDKNTSHPCFKWHCSLTGYLQK
jgi:hypothetical protein